MSSREEETSKRKISIVISKSSLEEVYPGLIMANGARMAGIDAFVFFTFFGMEAIIDKKMDRLKVENIGKPGGSIPNLISGIPGMSMIATNKMKKDLEVMDIPPIRNFIERIHDIGAEIYACKATVDMFRLKREDFCEQLDDIISVEEFYDKSADAQIIFT